MQCCAMYFSIIQCNVWKYNARCKDFEVGGLRVTRGNVGMSFGWWAACTVHRFLEVLTFIPTLLFNSNSTAAHRLIILITKEYLRHWMINIWFISNHHWHEQLLVVGLHFVLRALRSLRPCDSRASMRWASNGQTRTFDGCSCTLNWCKKCYGQTGHIWE